MRRQRDLHSRGQRARGDHLTARLGRRHLGTAGERLEDRDHRVVFHLLGVDDQLVERGIGDVDLVEIAHSAGLLEVVAAHELGGRAIVGRLTGHLGGALDPLLHPVLERTDDPGAEHVRDAAEQPLATAAHQDAVVVFGELEAGRLEHGDVMARLGVEALEQSRLRLIEM